MEHLTVDEMIDFVSINKLDNESLTLAKKVNVHIMNCDICREKVAAFQTVYDEFVKMGKSGDFNKTVKGTDSRDYGETRMERFRR